VVLVELLEPHLNPIDGVRSRISTSREILSQAFPLAFTLVGRSQSTIRPFDVTDLGFFRGVTCGSLNKKLLLFEKEGPLSVFEGLDLILYSQHTKRRTKRQWHARRVRNGHGEKEVWRRCSRAHSLRFLGPKQCSLSWSNLPNN